MKRPQPQTMRLKSSAQLDMKAGLEGRSPLRSEMDAKKIDAVCAVLYAEQPVWPLPPLAVAMLASKLVNAVTYVERTAYIKNELAKQRTALAKGRKK